MVEIENKVVTAYHRTGTEANAKSIIQHGFDTKIYRAEIYLTASWESANSLDGSTGADYGSYLLRCKVDTARFPITGHAESGGGDGDILVITDPTIISDIEFTFMNIDDPKYWVNGEVGRKFITPFPTSADFIWNK
jgi:hypothetical protein